MSNYLKSILNNEALNDGTIHDIRSNLKVKAFDFIRSTFKPSKGEGRFFVTAGKERLLLKRGGIINNANCWFYK